MQARQVAMKGAQRRPRSETEQGEEKQRLESGSVK
jgi:hypothetical protein